MAKLTASFYGWKHLAVWFSLCLSGHYTPFPLTNPPGQLSEMFLRPTTAPPIITPVPPEHRSLSLPGRHFHDGIFNRHHIPLHSLFEISYIPYTELTKWINAPGRMSTRHTTQSKEPMPSPPH